MTFTAVINQRHCPCPRAVVVVLLSASHMLTWLHCSSLHEPSSSQNSLPLIHLSLTDRFNGKHPRTKILLSKHLKACWHTRYQVGHLFHFDEDHNDHCVDRHYWRMLCEDTVDPPDKVIMIPPSYLRASRYVWHALLAGTSAPEA